MWNREDYKGNPITFYEEKEYKLLEEKLATYKRLMYNMFKACEDDSINLKHYLYGVLKSIDVLDEFIEKRANDEV